MVLSKARVVQAKIKKIQIAVYQNQKHKVFLKKKDQPQLRKKKAAGRKGKTVVANTKKAKVSFKNGGEVRKIARGCGKVMNDRRKKTKYS